MFHVDWIIFKIKKLSRIPIPHFYGSHCTLILLGQRVMDDFKDNDGQTKCIYEKMFVFMFSIVISFCKLKSSLLIIKICKIYRYVALHFKTPWMVQVVSIPFYR